jgi:GNAT superfamily N-acetyltransferase
LTYNGQRSLTNGEFHEFFDAIKPVLDPRQMLIGEVDGEPAGFCLGMPDWSPPTGPLFRSFQGKLGLVQIVRLMLGAKRYRRAGLLGIGALPAYRGTGLAQRLAIALYSRYEELGLKEAFYYPVNEENARSRNFAESQGGTGRVLAHCYDKRLH